MAPMRVMLVIVLWGSSSAQANENCKDEVTQGTNMLQAALFHSKTSVGEDGGSAVENEEVVADSLDEAFTCASGWTLSGLRCFWPSPVGTTWRRAEVACKRKGAGVELATIDDDAQNSAVRDLLPNTVMWIGANAINQADRLNYVNIDGSALAYTNWWSNKRKSEPSASGPDEKCVIMGVRGATDYEWYDVNCEWAEPRYVCATDVGTPVCKDDWHYADGSCFHYDYYNFPTGSWWDGENYCKQQGGILAKITSPLQNALVREITNYHSPVDPTKKATTTSVWIGVISLPTDGTLRYADATMVNYTRFETGEPVRGDGDDCMLMGLTGPLKQEWYDANCAWTAPTFACSADPTHLPPLTPCDSVPKIPSDSSSFKIMAPKHVVSTAAGSYACSYHTLPIDASKRQHIVYFKTVRSGPALDAGLSHHVVMNACAAPLPGIGDGDAVPCDDTMDSCSEQLLNGGYSPPYQYGHSLPDDTGIPIGRGGTLHVVISRHFYNDLGVSDVVDNGTGYEVVYVDTLRPYETNIITLGTTAVSVPPNTMQHTVSAFCGSTCTQRMGKVRVMSVHGHMHAHGVRMTVRLVRKGVEKKPIANIAPYVPGQEIVSVDRLITKNDLLFVDCTYDNPTADTLVYGHGSKSEMCFAFLTVAAPTGTGGSGIIKCFDYPDFHQFTQPAECNGWETSPEHDTTYCNFSLPRNYCPPVDPAASDTSLPLTSADLQSGFTPYTGGMPIHEGCHPPATEPDAKPEPDLTTTQPPTSIVVGETCHTKKCESTAKCESGYVQSCKLDGPASKKLPLNPWKVSGVRVEGNACIATAYKDSTGITVTATCGAAPTKYVDTGKVWMEGQTTLSCPNGVAVQCMCSSAWSVYQCGEDADAVPIFEPQNGVCTRTIMHEIAGAARRRRGAASRRRGVGLGAGAKIGAICSE
eukprot:TRINITY_DN25950_c0_g1_i1.p1 TRINITY_DN25950_c0_g1~~TRINITY_DN25950_c0_g1_i1.p1  ORF type:complete len:925 (-),score=69.25 TRINITY_DN25950_c0_g1_i1:116-2890(-)